MARPYKYVLVSALVMVGCSDSSHPDLRLWMEEIKNKPKGEIEPLPTFQPYVTFKYSAMALRSPFDPPMQALANETGTGRKTVKPDENRRKEFLEGYNFAALSMVGTVFKDNVMWGLVNDGAGAIHRVRVGNYMGKNHGVVVSITPSQLDVIEIVPDGKGNWVERPRTLALREK